MMNKTDIVKKVCEILEVKHSHFDDHMSSVDYFPHMKLDSPVRVVAYPGMCPWSFAILENMEVITPTSGFSELMLMCVDSIEEAGGQLSEEHRETEIEILEEIKRLAEAKKFLIENNCAVVINGDQPNPDL